MLAPFEAPDLSVPPSRARRSPLRKSACEFLFALSFCVLCMSHSVSAQGIEADEVVRVRTDIVTVPIIAVDSHGHRVLGLRQSDFVLSTEGRPQRIEFLATGASRVALVFLLDASGSARDYLRDQRDVALSLFSRFGPQSEVALLRFSDSTTIAVPFSVDTRKARDGFDFPASPGRHTAIFNSAMTALQLLSERKKDPTERRIVILTSDGLDTASSVKASDVIERALKENVSFYVIHFPIYTPQEGRLKPRPAARGFRNLAERTAGHYFVAGEPMPGLAGHAQVDLSPVFKAIEEDLASQYLLGFYPDEASRDGRLHRIAVTPTRRVSDFRIKTLRDDFRLIY
jgi:Ca-activated chloride channel homolog